MSKFTALKWKKTIGETQTLRAGCSKAEPKISPRRRPPCWGRRTTKIQSAGDGHYLHLQTQFGEDRCTQFRVTSYRGNRPTNTQRSPARPLQTGPITIHCAAKFSAQHNYEYSYWKITCLIEIVVKQSWKITFALSKVVRQESVSEVGPFLFSGVKFGTGNY